MECDVQESGTTDGGAVQSITFLYTLGEGACPRSFGINVARLANLPEGVLRIAQAKSKIFESEMNGEEGEGSSGKDVEMRKQIEEAAKKGDFEVLNGLWKCLQQ
jgi:DNA mismatch repair ATPase MutS